MRRGECDPAWYTLEEYFKEGQKKGKYPRKQKASAPAKEESAGDELVEFEDSSKAAMLRPIKCRLCGGLTRSYERDSDAGIQHFAVVNGRREEVSNRRCAAFEGALTPQKKTKKASRCSNVRLWRPEEGQEEALAKG